MPSWKASTLLAAACAAQAVVASPFGFSAKSKKPEEKKVDADCDTLISPKVFIVDMFSYEAAAWYGIPEFDLFGQNITVPGFSPIYPDAYCTADGEICQLVTGESEINAATTITALAYSGLFNLTETYFLIAGIAGVSPKVGTLGSVTFARYAVQVALQYEFDAREMPSNWSTGYFGFGDYVPNTYPTTIYGTEVFEVNNDLKLLAMEFAKTAVLNDSDAAIAYRANYGVESEYQAAYFPGTQPPSVIECDVATSDVYYSGTLLGEAFENTTALWTNDTGVYCTTAQEDNASLEAFMRADISGLVDFSRIIVMRTASDFDRPYPGQTAEDNLLYADQGGFYPAIYNIYFAGVKVVEGIIAGWDATFKAGVKPTNYIGDIFGTLGGEPDFGFGSEFDGQGETLTKREAEMPSRRTMKGKRGIPVRLH